MKLSDDVYEWCLERITAGDSQASIAQALGVSAGHLSEALNEPDRKERSARARQASAEAWLDRGMQYLIDASTKASPYDAQAARALAQECARRAAIRNPAYRDNAKLELSGPNGGPIRTIAATVTPEEAAAIYKEALG